MAQGIAVCRNLLPAHSDPPAVSESSSSSDPPWDCNELRTSLEEDLSKLLTQYSLPPLTETMRYALSGGHRLRGLLLLAVADSCGPVQQAREAAAVIEMLHAASLVVDDLPALDDTPVRRGRLSLYKRFGEAAAILTAHALVAAAFEITAQMRADPKQLLRITKSLAAAIGARGMARAELTDRPESSGSDIEIRALKTGSLFQMAAHIGAVLAGAMPDLADDLGRLGLELGTCYQFVDDFRDHLVDGPNRKTLKESSRIGWQQSVELFSLIRGRLHKARPLETWLSSFYNSGVMIVLGHGVQDPKPSTVSNG